jgi:hypothetical protein
VVEDVRRALLEGHCSISAVGSVVTGRGGDLPFVVVDGDGQVVEPVSAYLRDLMLGDASPLTCRSYAFDLLRWHRLLWMLETPWEKATEAEVAVLVGWLRQARNPQRLRRLPHSSPPGSVNFKTGKPSLRAGYAPSTINHALTVIGRWIRQSERDAELLTVLAGFLRHIIRNDGDEFRLIHLLDRLSQDWAEPLCRDVARRLRDAILSSRVGSSIA